MKFAQGSGLENWQSLIKDTGTLEDRAEPFVQSLLILDLDNLKALAPSISDLIDQSAQNLTENLGPILEGLRELRKLK